MDSVYFGFGNLVIAILILFARSGERKPQERLRGFFGMK